MTGKLLGHCGHHGDLCRHQTGDCLSHWSPLARMWDHRAVLRGSLQAQNLLTDLVQGGFEIKIKTIFYDKKPLSSL